MKLNREWQQQWDNVEMPEEKLNQLVQKQLQQSSKPSVKERIKASSFRKLFKNKYTWLALSGAALVFLLVVSQELLLNQQSKQSKSYSNDYAEVFKEESEMDSEAGQEESAVESNTGEVESYRAEASFKKESSKATEETSTNEATNNDKLVYFYSFIKYTENFTKDTEKLNELVQKFDGYVDNAEVGGASSYSYSAYQQASYQLRIPVSKKADFLKELDTVGKTTNQQVRTENYSASYADNESAIKALETEEQALIELLAKSSQVDEMLKIQDRLTTLRTKRENLVRENRSIDNQVDYVTIEIDIHEITSNNKNQVKEEPTVWMRIESSFKSQGQFWLSFGQNLVVILVSLLPYLVILGIILLVAIYWLKRKKVNKSK